ncbi:fimbria/pilus periplasmic chaperone [Pantoea dispersa]|nr:fimbria/pilus periplasmic chaperone [Pantoea dispersa]UYP72468.1 fimbria/pilus periplasmic chaperone [Pantoea dispersa]
MMLSSSVMARSLAMLALTAAVLPHFALAEITPSSSAVIIEAGKNEASIDIKNNGNKSVLLYSKIRKLPDDNLAHGTLFTEPQVILLAPGDTQSIRIIYRTNTPDSHEHIARVVFTGLPPQDEVSEGKIKILIGQDLPVVVNLRKNIEQKDMWQIVKYRLDEGKLCIQNPSAKVFRFVPTMNTDEKHITVTFNKSYVLPGEEMCSASSGQLLHGMHLNIVSVSDYNYQLKSNKVIL